MATRRGTLRRGGVAVAPAPTSPAPLPASRLPAPMRFPLVVLMSISLSTFLLSFSGELTGYETASISRSLNDWNTISSLLAWRVGELAFGWYFGYDDLDFASLTVLTRAPYLYFVNTFYGISLATATILLAIDVASTTLPFTLLRPRAPYHAPNAPKSAVPNSTIINDFPTKAAVTAAVAGVYALVIYASFTTWLPVYLVTHFDGIRSLEKAHSVGLLLLFPYCVPVGMAARIFLFSPSVAAQTNLGDAKAQAFNPETATLSETVEHNLYGSKKRTQVLGQRTAALVLLTALNTSVQTYMVLEGAELWGAVGWAALWAVADVAAAGIIGWCGDI